MLIRPADVADAAALSVVHVRSWQAGYAGLIPQAYLNGLDPEQRRPRWQQVLAAPDWPRAGTWLAESGTGVVGFVSVCPTRDDDQDADSVGEVAAAYVLPEQWRLGIGRQLVAAGLASMGEAGFAEATLWVLAANERGRRFYEAAGWRADGAAKVDQSWGFPLHEVRYRRRLG